MPQIFYEIAAPGPMVLKYFTFVTYKCSYLARVFVLSKTFQPNIIFVGKVRSLIQSRAPERCLTKVGSSLTCQLETRMQLETGASKCLY